MWSYNSFYDNPNNVLAHSSHKYIDKYEKNGKTVYVYDGEYVANHPLTSVNKKTLSGNSTLRKYGPLKTRAQRQKDKQYYDSSRVANAAKQAEKERIAKSTPKKQLDRDAALKKIGILLEERKKATLDPDRRNAQSSREAAIQESAKKVQQQNKEKNTAANAQAAREAEIAKSLTKNKSTKYKEPAIMRSNYQNEVDRILSSSKKDKRRDAIIELYKDLDDKYDKGIIDREEYLLKAHYLNTKFWNESAGKDIYAPLYPSYRKYDSIYDEDYRRIDRISRRSDYYIK